MHACFACFATKQRSASVPIVVLPAAFELRISGENDAAFGRIRNGYPAPRALTPLPRSREPRPVGRCGDRQISTARGATAVLWAAHAQVRASQASNVPNFECSKQRAASLRPLRWSSSPPCGAWLVISLSIRYCWDHEPGSFHSGAQRVLVLVQSCYSAAATDLGQTKCALRVSLLHVGYRQPCMFGSRR